MIQEHLASASALESGQFACGWATCTRQAPSAAALVGHCVAHYPLPSPVQQQAEWVPPADTYAALPDSHVLSTEAYLAACVVYLLSRYPEAREYLTDMETTLFEIAQRKYSPTARYATEILAILTQK